MNNINIPNFTGEIASLIYNKRGKILFSYNKSNDFFRNTDDIILGKTINDIFTTEESKERFDCIKKMIETGEDMELEYEVLHQKKIFKYKSRMIPLTDFLSRNTIILELISNLEIKKVQDSGSQVIKRLKMRNEAVDSLLENIPIPVFKRDEGYNIKFVNKKFCEDYGNATGKKCFELMLECENLCKGCMDYKEKIPYLTQDFILCEKNKFIFHTIPIKEPDGDSLLLGFGMERINEDNKNIEHDVKTIIDSKEIELATIKARLSDEIKSRSEAVIEYSKSVEKSHLLFHKSIVPIFITDLNGCLIDLNESAMDLFNEGVLSIKNKSIFDYVINENKNILRDILNSLTSKTVNTEIIFSINNIQITCELNLCKIEWNEEKAVLILGKDITEKKQQEKENRKLMDELAERNEDMKSMLQIITHDLRKPLINILGYSEILDEECQEINNIAHNEYITVPEIKEYINSIRQKVQYNLHYIKNSGNRMSSLLKLLSKIMNADKIKTEIKSLDMNKIIIEIIEDMNYQITQFGVQINFDNLQTCLGDEIQINQVFYNLIDNAIKYRDKNRQCKIFVSSQIKENIVEYCIEDNGIGIKKELKDKIFDLFYRIDDSEGIDGEGVGLTAVKNIVKRYNGKVWCESVYGKGTKFFIELPSGDGILNANTI
ncbi:MAG: multi-sensor signal transduction histidine kinase [uncultured bacterium]|nr:MAG: multi-sensor signal transduction histidine kinase [uncultured bacterium]